MNPIPDRSGIPSMVFHPHKNSNTSYLLILQQVLQKMPALPALLLQKSFFLFSSQISSYIQSVTFVFSFHAFTHCKYLLYFHFVLMSTNAVLIDSSAFSGMYIADNKSMLPAISPVIFTMPPSLDKKLTSLHRKTFCLHLLSNQVSTYQSLSLTLHSNPAGQQHRTSQSS